MELAEEILSLFFTQKIARIINQMTTQVHIQGNQINGGEQITLKRKLFASFYFSFEG